MHLKISLYLKVVYFTSLASIISTHLIVAEDVRPNIVFIYTDDQAPWALGASGNPQAKTPNMDRLAREGAYLMNAFVTTPVCSPARASIMTSQYASEYGIFDFIAQPGHILYDPENEIGLDPQSVTFAEVLAGAGYINGLVGKWHLGDWTQTENKKYHPTNHGFHYFMGITGGGTSPDNPPLEKDGAVREFKGLTTDILTDHALEFIKTHADSTFMLCLNYRAPHGKWLPVADADWAPYANIDPVIPNPNYPDLDKERVKHMMREYLASLHGVDRNMGRLFNLLDSLRLTDHTIIIFSSDHGYNMGHNGITHKGNGIWVTKSLPPATENILSKYRPNLYDNSLRVPAIVKWPDAVEPGTVISETVSSLDWYPTLLEMADVGIPEQKIVRGRSIVPLLKGEKVGSWNNDFYAEYSMINYAKAYMRAYRTPEWKLIRDFLNPGRDELYNIAKNPEENINMIQDSREEIRQVVNTLDQKIKEQMKQINDPLLKKLNH